MRKAALLPVLTAMALAVPAAPARAESLPDFVCGPAPEGARLTVCVKGHVQLVPVGAATGTVVAVCEAVVLGVVTATTVGCQLNALAGGAYANAANVSLPGPAALTTLMATVPLQPYAICVGGNYVSTDGSLGSSEGWVLMGCFSSVV